ncbi:hypothetical protein V2W30_01425 [Streptomyces sp. Q6]|uniref:Uncharacterized protein n=1 Tax=Streptomyces citrinus TaxID=3118173 RepID=A0ACD5A8G8_9ACTN
MPLAFVGRALVTHEEVPPKLGQLMNVERGINDGLALPVALIRIAGAAPTAGYAESGIAIGPMGLVSVVSGLLVLQAGIPQGEHCVTRSATLSACVVVRHREDGEDCRSTARCRTSKHVNMAQQERGPSPGAGLRKVGPVLGRGSIAAPGTWSRLGLRDDRPRRGMRTTALRRW